MSRQRFGRLAWGLLGYNLAVILWGAWVRASGSGAGCGEHWSTCNGTIIPRSPSTATLIEFTHRTTSGLALLLTVALVVGAFRLWPRGHRVRRASLTALGFMVLEALLGAGLVLFGLVGDDASPARAVVMMVHLSNTLFLLAGMALAALWSTDDRAIRLDRSAGVSLGIAVGSVVLVGVTGAIAALGDTLFPAMSLIEGLAADLDPRSHFLLQLRTLHPVFAVLCGGYLIALGARWRAGQTRVPANLLIGLVVTQLFAGFINLALLAPVWLQLVHLLLADLVWVALIVFCVARLSDPDKSAAPGRIPERPML